MDRVEERDAADAASLRARNVRTALILATVALAFFVGVILKYVLR